METSMVEDLMLVILNVKSPSVFRVSLEKKDYEGLWGAHADLRGADKSYATWDITPEGALQALLDVLNSLTCKYCGNKLE